MAAVLFCGSANAQLALSSTPIQHFVDNNGEALSGGKLFTYAAGTTTKLATYTSSAGTTPNTNPIILNSRGEAQVWLTGSPYKFVLSPSTDSDPPTNPIWTVDQITGTGGGGAITLVAACNSDITAVLNASQALLPTGGMLTIPSCPYKISDPGVVITSPNLHIQGAGAIYYPGMLDSSPTGGVIAPTPATTGTDITCTGTSSPCVTISTIGTEIDHINWANPQNPPTSCTSTCGNWNPTIFPFVLATIGTSSWNGLFLHHMTFTGVSQCIDIEGTPNYTSNGTAGSQWNISDMWFNPCLNVGIREHNVDNTGRVTNLDYDFWWYRSFGPVGWYVENHSVGLDLQYAANTEFVNVEFFVNKTGIQFTNGSVYGGFGAFAVVSAGSNLQFTNIDFNLTCQAVALPGGNGTSVTAIFTNVIAYQDNGWCNGSTAVSGGGIGEGGTNPTPVFFDFASDAADIKMSGVRASGTQAFSAIGHGVGGNLNINQLNVFGYSRWSAGQPAFRISAGAHFTLSGTDYSAIVPWPGAGLLEGPGLDGTQGFMQPISVGGGGALCAEGGVQVRPSGTNRSGFMEFYPCPAGPTPGTLGGTPTGRNGYVGNGDSTGIILEADTGGVFLLPNGSTVGSPQMQVNSNGATLIININRLPISCAGLSQGTLWDNANVLQVCP